MSLAGGNRTAFPGTIVDRLTEPEALTCRDVHLKLREVYRESDQAHAIAAHTARLEVVRVALMEALASASSGHGAARPG